MASKVLDGYMLFAKCMGCQSLFSVKDVKNGVGPMRSEALQNFVDGVKRYIGSLDEGNPDYEAIKKGRNVDLGLSGFPVSRHGNCNSKIENISFRLESVKIYSPGMIKELGKYNFFKLDGQ